jgi:hypothetical protein
MNKKQVIICVGVLVVGFVLGFIYRIDRDRYFLVNAGTANMSLPLLLDKWDGRVWRYSTKGFEEIDTSPVRNK